MKSKDTKQDVNVELNEEQLDQASGGTNLSNVVDYINKVTNHRSGEDGNR